MNLREQLDAGMHAARNARFPTTLTLDGGDVIVGIVAPRASWHQRIPLDALAEDERALLPELIKTGTRELS